jgi:hypothetical protein
MPVASVIVSLLAALLSFAAVRKLSHRKDVVESYVRVGVPEDKLNYLAVILLAGAAGLMLGLFWTPLGVAAAIGVTCYFLLAIAAHIRADDVANLPTPLMIEALAVAALVLQLD